MCLSKARTMARISWNVSPYDYKYFLLDGPSVEQQPVLVSSVLTATQFRVLGSKTVGQCMQNSYNKGCPAVT